VPTNARNCIDVKLIARNVLADRRNASQIGRQDGGNVSHARSRVGDAARAMKALLANEERRERATMTPMSTTTIISSAIVKPARLRSLRRRFFHAIQAPGRHGEAW